MRIVLVVLSLMVVAGSAHSQGIGNGEKSKPQLPQMGFTNPTYPGGVAICPNLSTWNSRETVFQQEEKDATNFIKFRTSDPTKAFAYLGAMDKASDEIQAITTELCSTLPANTDVLVLSRMLDVAHNHVVLIKTEDGQQGIVTENSIEFY